MQPRFPDLAGFTIKLSAEVERHIVDTLQVWEYVGYAVMAFLAVAALRWVFGTPSR